MHEEAAVTTGAKSACVPSASAESIVESLSAQNKTIAAAESCTGGLIADWIVRIPGASKVFWGSFVCYTEDAKVKMLGVPPELIKGYGVVSRETALAMAEGALKKSGADWAFSVTGFAGPTADDDNPAGTVWIAVAGEHSEARGFHFNGSRNQVREQAAIAALDMVLEKLKDIDIKAD